MLSQRSYGTWSQVGKISPPLALVPKPQQPLPDMGCKFLEGQRVSVIAGVLLKPTQIQHGYVKRVFAVYPRQDKRWVNVRPGYMVVVKLDNGLLWYGSEEDLARDVYKASLAQEKVRGALKVASRSSAPRSGTLPPGA